MADMWAAADAAQNGGTTESQAIPAPAEGQGESQLFGGGPVAPSLFNKTHQLGTVRTGIITKAPFDRQKVDFNTKMPLFWPRVDHPAAEKRKPVSIADGGDPRDPVMDTFFELDTEYSMDAAEAAATSREAPYEGGERVFVAGGLDLKATRKGMEQAIAAGMRIQSGADLIGKRITVKRTGQKPNPSGNPSWIIEVRFSAA